MHTERMVPRIEVGLRKPLSISEAAAGGPKHSEGSGTRKKKKKKKKKKSLRQSGSECTPGSSLSTSLRMHARPIYIISLMCNVLLLFSVLWVYSSGGSSGDAVLPSAQMPGPLSPPVAAAPEAAALASSQQQRQQSSLVQPAAGLSARAPLPTGMVSYDTLEAAAAAIAEPMRWGGKGATYTHSGARTRAPPPPIMARYYLAERSI